jgi:hypothetical protein
MLTAAGMIVVGVFNALSQSLMKNPRSSLHIPLFKNLILYAGKCQLIELSSNFNHVPPYKIFYPNNGLSYNFSTLFPVSATAVSASGFSVSK